MSDPCPTCHNRRLITVPVLGTLPGIQPLRFGPEITFVEVKTYDFPCPTCLPINPHPERTPSNVT